MTRGYTKQQAKLIENMTFADLYKEISSDWEKKARALQNRRWEKLHSFNTTKELV